MRRLIRASLALVCLWAAAANSSAQELVLPLPAPLAPGPIQQVVHHNHGACAAPCPTACPATCKSCFAEPTKIKVVTAVYGCKSVDFCLPKCCCGGCNLFGHCNKGCNKGCHNDCHQPCEPECKTGACGKVRTKSVLLKKFVTEEVCATKCTVVESPAAPCAAPCPTKCAAPCADPCHTGHGHRHASTGVFNRTVVRNGAAPATTVTRTVVPAAPEAIAAPRGRAPATTSVSPVR